LVTVCSSREYKIRMGGTRYFLGHEVALLCDLKNSIFLLGWEMWGISRLGSSLGSEVSND